MNDDITKFGLSSTYFDGMRKELDRYIGSAFRIMENKGTTSSKISLSIDIYTESVSISDAYAPMGVREAVRPLIEYKIGFKTESKAESKDTAVGNGYELAKDEIGNYYIISSQSAGGQISMFEGDKVERW